MCSQFWVGSRWSWGRGDHKAAEGVVCEGEDDLEEFEVSDGPWSWLDLEEPEKETLWLLPEAIFDILGRAHRNLLSGPTWGLRGIDIVFDMRDDICVVRLGR